MEGYLGYQPGISCGQQVLILHLFLPFKTKIMVCSLHTFFFTWVEESGVLLGKCYSGSLVYGSQQHRCDGVSGLNLPFMSEKRSGDCILSLLSPSFHLARDHFCPRSKTNIQKGNSDKMRKNSDDSAETKSHYKRMLIYN